MKSGGVILIVLGLFTIFLGVTGKWCCFLKFFECAFSKSLNPCDCQQQQNTSQVSTPLSNLTDTIGLTGLPQLPPLPGLGSFG